MRRAAFLFVPMLWIGSAGQGCGRADGQHFQDYVGSSGHNSSNDGDGGVSTGEGGVSNLQAGVTFQLRTSRADLCVGSPSACVQDWLTILRSDGSAVAIHRGCNADCSECLPVACAGSCDAATVLLSTVERRWDGSLLAWSSCQGAAGDAVACSRPEAAPAGNYVARMCALSPRASSGGAEKATCAASTQPTCVDVPFTWPQSGRVSPGWEAAERSKQC